VTQEVGQRQAADAERPDAQKLAAAYALGDGGISAWNRKHWQTPATPFIIGGSYKKRALNSVHYARNFEPMRVR